MVIQKHCPNCADQTDGRKTPHTVKNGNYKCGLCGHETPKRTRVTKKARDMEDLIKKLGEAKDPREYGYEGEMAMSQLKGIIQHAKQLHDMLEPDTDLPEWVQSKITLAYDYMQTAADYMSTEMNEEVQIDELSKDTLKSYLKKTNTDVSNKILKIGKARRNDDKEEVTKLSNKIVKRHGGMFSAQKKLAQEEAPANAVGGGNIAGMGVDKPGRPGSGEPGVGPKAMKKYKDQNAAEAPKAGRKTFSMFLQSK